MTSPAGSAQGFLDGPPRRVPQVDPATTGLSLATSAGPARFMIHGQYARVSGDQRRPVGTVDFFGSGRAEDFRVGAGRAANLVLFPGMCRRDFVGPEGVHLETVVVAPSLPLVVIQWGGDGAPSSPIDFLLRLTDDDPTPSLVSTEGTIAVVEGGAGLAARTDPAGSMSVVQEGPSAFRFSVTSQHDQPLSLVLAAGRAQHVRAAFAAAGHLHGHVLRATTGPCVDGLSLPLGIAEVDDAFSWAKVRLRGHIDELAATPRYAVPPTAALELGLAAAAVGDRDGSGRLLSLPILAGTPEEAILAARHAATFGDVTRAAEVARRRLANPVTPPDGASLWRLADGALSDGLLYTAPEDMRAALRGLVSKIPRGQRSLPVVGHQQPKDAGKDRASVTRALLSGVPTEQVNVHGPLNEARRIAASFLQRPVEAWQSWRQLMASGLESGPDGPATWHEDESGSAAAALLLAFTQGMLGLVPDAPAGRLRLAPRMPGHLSRFAVDGITLGDATATLRYQRSDHRHRFELTPQRAAVPMLVVFEPAVAGTVREVRVDGAVADLDLRAEGSLTVTPVQLPLDGVRTVEVTTEP